MRSLLLLLLTATALVISCGEAGVQVRVGDEYISDFNITGAAAFTSFNANPIDVEVNSDLVEVGAILSDIEVQDLFIETQNYDGGATGTLTFEVSNFTGGSVSVSVPFPTTASTEITDQAFLNAVAGQIQNSDISIRVLLDIPPPTTLGDNDFTVQVRMTVYGTASED